jgi:hypothetical protein
MMLFNWTGYEKPEDHCRTVKIGQESQKADRPRLRSALGRLK